ncbi:twin-arginine translocase subunit TatC [Helicobacter mustelae]|uniref:Sec-independent protein translocase protein TatC n=1 Tax=Helicobacter mustelae (strain ATCC 43772 / CCUG 25715 / CIP 103759 / LMG 18044 / NCTC 12198 / R85-136P) TaxID=679897 RepID=D3UFV2_HELM1|nr:twin-arginine translocase subunit TatC [Helicobacter mustelae]CBG39373.1 sec-independant protein translocase, TatC [Helicobacter mustelae 12198]SQH70886.1 Sec-independent protein translocase TatC [Helicobacter mustelae]STP12012.1 Sec-independent protein translocase TatC [Helicobacter mustelae]
MFEDLKPHIQDLRKRLMIAVGTLIVVFIACFNFWREIFEYIKKPIEGAFDGQVQGMLIQTAPAEGIIVALKVSFFVALGLSIPVIFWQIWAFVAPGLYKHEKKIVLPFVFFGSLMFFCGVAFAYFLAFPYAIKYILMFGNDEFTANITAANYITFFTRFVLGFGIAFELPVLAFFLAKIDLITDQTLKRNFKYAIVGIFIIAAIITPPDVLSQVLMALPLIFLYGLSILIVAWVNPAPKDPQKEATESEKESQEAGEQEPIKLPQSKKLPPKKLPSKKKS